jgi:type VI secretion system secreted protein VgrG
MEVVVTFEGGDPDKPMVLGSLYNGTHPMPFVLPGDRTRSGIRTQSTPGGGGYNELSFEDAAGREQIFVHAQKNFDEVVEKNHTLLVRNDEIIRVLANRVDTIQKDLDEHVHGDHRSRVDGNRIDVVEGSSDERVSGVRATRVEGRERLAVQGPADLDYADDLTTRVKGCVTTVVGKNDKKRSWVTHAEGTSELSSSDGTRVASEKELVLRVGKSSIRITPDRIEIQAGAITAKGGGAGLSASDDGLALSSKGDAQMVVGKKLVLKTGGASLSMDQEVKVAGSKIHLGQPDQAKDPAAKDPKPPTKVELLEDSGSPLSHQRFVVLLPDGSQISGMTDGDGKAELDLPSGAKIAFPDLKEVRAD